MKSTMEVAKQFASYLDQDGFDSVSALLSESCAYDTGHGKLVGPEPIIDSYRSASVWGRKNLDEIRYESQVESCGERDATILFVDHLRKGDCTHIFRCKQVISISKVGKIEFIKQCEIDGERTRLNAFFGACGLKREDSSSG